MAKGSTTSRKKVARKVRASGNPSANNRAHGVKVDMGKGKPPARLPKQAGMGSTVSANVSSPTWR